MLEKLKLVEARFLEMEARSSQPDFYNDPKAASKLLREQKQLEPVVTAYRRYAAAVYAAVLSRKAEGLYRRDPSER